MPDARRGVGAGPSRSVSRRSWTSTAQGTPAYVISAATSAPADSAASSSPSRAAAVDAATAASCRASSRSARRCSAVSSTENSTGWSCVLGPSRSQCPDCSPTSSCPSTSGARRSRWWPSRRSWHRATRTPAASSGGYHRAVSSHTQRGRVDLPRLDVRRQVGQGQHLLRATVHDQHPVARQARELDPGHGDTLTPPPTVRSDPGMSHASPGGRVTDSPTSSTRGRHDGTSRASASSNNAPGASIQPRGNHAPPGRWSVFQCTGTAARAPLA